MRISETFKKKRPVISLEIFPPKKDGDLKNIEATLDVLSKLKPDYISVTFGAGGSANHNRTIDVARLIKEKYKIEPLVHMTSLHYDHREIQAFVQALKDNHLDNVLALRGDRNPKLAEKGVYKYASDVIGQLKQDSNLGIAAACYPEVHPESDNRVADLKHLKRKVDLGAEFLISQLFFDNQVFYDFSERARIAGIDVPITAGIMPIVNKNQIHKMVSLCGASIPQPVEKMLAKFGHKKEAIRDAGIIYAIHQIIDLLANDVDGIHLYTLNNPEVAKRIVDRVHHIIA